ncbi:MAG: ABC-F family ATP-binding cassette domain-containing protein [Bacteroidota bacterium]
MALLTFENVRKDYGTKPILDDASLVIEAGEKVGVIGANGAGKTTLLRIAAGVEPPDGGRVIVHNGARVGFLTQRPDFQPGQTVLDAVFAGTGPTISLVRDYEDVLHKLDQRPGDADLTARLTALSGKMDAAGAWDLEAQVHAVLDRLGITDTDATVETLSGGQRKRVALARVLVERPDLLILDEPTNHLDTETIGWLEGFLASWTGALLLVTHDRYFLDRVVSHMLEVAGGEVARYVGTYSDYLQKKAEEEELAAKAEATRANLAKRELAWLRRGAKARTSKSKARIAAAHALFEAKPDAPDAEIEISSVSSRLGKKVVELEGVTKGFDGRTLVRDFSRILTRGERIGIIGPNGAGKTTLLEMIAGRLAPDSGSVEIGPTVNIGYFDQESRILNDEQRVIDTITEVAENVRTADGKTITASQMLERFLFPGKAQYTPVGLLSGGERRRLVLLRVLMGAPNVLLLDEPTNDLDIPTLVALETYLDDFGGTLITVSHDRYFLDRTADMLLRFEDGGRIREIPGNYSAWLEIKAREDKARDAAEVARATKAPAPPLPSRETSTDAPKKLSYKEKRELEEVEARIAEAEERQPRLEALLTEHATDAEKVVAYSEELGALLTQLDADIERWAELADRA